MIVIMIIAAPDVKAPKVGQ